MNDVDDDIIFVEESYSTIINKRNSPVRILDEPGPSNCVSPPRSNATSSTMFTSYEERLLDLERLISCNQSSAENKRPSPKRNLEFVDVVDEVLQVPTICDEQLSPEKRKRKRKKVLSEAQTEKLIEKKRKAIEREISASIKSKCEQHLYCHVSRRLFNEFPETEVHTRMMFLERNVSDQLICDESRPDTQILWYRKCIEAIEVDGTVDKREYMALQHVFAIAMSSDTFMVLVKSNGLEDFITTQKLSHAVSNSMLILIVIGKSPRQLFDLGISLFDCCRAQLHYVHNASEFAKYLAQITRALAKMERHLAHHDRLVVDVDKGLRDAPLDELMCDWWNKMLAVVCRLQDGHRRAIVSAYPNPHIASRRFTEMGYTRAVKELAEIQSDSGRRLGPVLAHRLFMILTDSLGTEIVG
ncbi:hypothetical protein Q1695_009303 [Nippostrongylus brasiliensis]|nr:hypothetical protein Q1695_009303 [Nippostrongylus brasiliensis]